MEEDAEVIKLTPDDLGYKDRGIMKWQIKKHFMHSF